MLIAGLHTFAGRLIDSLPESTPELVEARVRANYKRYKVAKPAPSS